MAAISFRCHPITSESIKTLDKYLHDGTAARDSLHFVKERVGRGLLLRREEKNAASQPEQGG